MIISTISDVHVKNEKDHAHELLLKFMNHPQTLESDLIIFLGDIFDHMFGSHFEYLEKFNIFFEKLADLLKCGKKIIYMEGNHDFYNKKLFQEFIKRNNLDSYDFEYLIGEYTIDLEGTKVQFTHGDDIEIDNPTYKRYKKFITSNIFKFASDLLLSFKMVEKIGENASNKSRKHGASYFNENANKLRFRKSAELQAHNYDIIVCGHSHIQENYRFELNNRKCLYINNGFLPRDKCFVHYNKKWQLIPLV